jgi:hypothetical protein
MFPNTWSKERSRLAGVYLKYQIPTAWNVLIYKKKIHGAFVGGQTRDGI